MSIAVQFFLGWCAVCVLTAAVLIGCQELCIRSRRRCADRGQLLAAIKHRDRLVERLQCDKAQMAGWLEGQEEAFRRQRALLEGLTLSNTKLRDENATLRRYWTGALAEAEAAALTDEALHTWMEGQS